MDTSQLLLISGLSFVACFLAVTGFFAVSDSRRDRRDWKSRAKGFSTEAQVAMDTSLTGFEYVRDRILGVLAKIGRANQSQEKGKDLSKLRQSLITAGYRGDGAPYVFTGVKLLMAALAPIGLLLFPLESLEKAPLAKQAMAYLVAAAVGLYGPELWLSRVVENRKLRMLHGFPDTLDLLIVCVESGLGLDAAFARISKELALAHPDLCGEFHVLALELRAGLPRSQALVNLGKRTDLDEVKGFATLLIQTDRFGTSVGRALRVHSDAMRVERTQKAEELAGKLPVKLLFPLMLFIFPTIFIVILGPAVIKIRAALEF